MGDLDLSRLVRLPLGVDPHEPGNIVDADGDHVMQVDINRERPDAQVAAIAAAVVAAINRGSHGYGTAI